MIRDEPAAGRLLEAMSASSEIGVGAPTLTEASIVLGRRYGPTGRSILGHFLQRNKVADIPFERDHWNVSAEAFLRFGKSRHPAALNLGDCMTYATAQVAGAPLLFTGEDFAKTDVVAA